MDPLIDHDRSRYVAALDKACGVFLKVGEDVEKTMLDFTEEPIGTSARNYQKDQKLKFRQLNAFGSHRASFRSKSSEARRK
jgi:hypothetical protein